MIDATSRAGHMRRGSCMLYRNPHFHDPGAGPDPPEYIGVIRVQTGELYWIHAWNRYVNHKCVIEIALNPKH